MVKEKKQNWDAFKMWKSHSCPQNVATIKSNVGNGCYTSKITTWVRLKCSHLFPVCHKKLFAFFGTLAQSPKWKIVDTYLLQCRAASTTSDSLVDKYFKNESISTSFGASPNKQCMIKASESNTGKYLQEEKPCNSTFPRASHSSKYKSWRTNGTLAWVPTHNESSISCQAPEYISRPTPTPTPFSGCPVWSITLKTILLFISTFLNSFIMSLHYHLSASYLKLVILNYHMEWFLLDSLHLQIHLELVHWLQKLHRMYQRN